MGKKPPRYVTGQQAINLRKRLFWSEEFGVGAITNLYDAFGDETDDEEDAAQAVVKINEGCWLSVDLTAFETRSAH